MQRDAGEMPRDSGQGQAAVARCRVKHGDVAAPDFFEHHKVVQIPVQDAGQCQLGQLVNLKTQRAAAEVQAAGVGDQLLQRGPFEGYRESEAQVEQIELQAVGVGNHGQAGEGAFVGFGLEDGVHCREPLKLIAELTLLQQNTNPKATNLHFVVK